MEFSAYAFWQFIHLLLFVYWLGADLGVFFAAKYVARSDLPTAERYRFLDLTLLLDMGPRTSLILLPAVGFQLSYMAGYIVLSLESLIFIWILTIAWLVVMWLVHVWRKRESTGGLRLIDKAMRYAVIGVMGILGVASLVTGFPVQETWWAIKFILYAGTVATGLYLRHIISDWERGFRLISTQSSRAQGNALIKTAGAKGEQFALLLWGQLIVIAYLGLAKPI